MKRGSSRRLMLAPKSFMVAMVVSPWRSALRHLLGRPLDGLDDVVVAGAAAEIALELMPDLSLAGIRIPLDHLRGRHDHAGRAEPALQAVLLPEPFLDRVQRAVSRHPFDGLEIG